MEKWRKAMGKGSGCWAGWVSRFVLTAACCPFKNTNQTSKSLRVHVYKYTKGVHWEKLLLG